MATNQTVEQLDMLDTGSACSFCKYRNLSEDGLLLLDWNGRIRMINPAGAELLDSNPDNLIKKEFIEFVEPNDRGQFLFYRKQINEGVHREACELKLLKENKSVELLSFSTIWDSRSFDMVILRDIARHELMQEQLEQANREMKKSLNKQAAELENKKQYIEEIDTALKVLLNKRDEDQKEMARKMMISIENLVLPYLEKLKEKISDSALSTYLGILESNLDLIFSPVRDDLSFKYMKLTSAELAVADLVRHGNSTKEIASILNISIKTVETHRGNIRKKMGLNNRKTTLRKCLLSLQ